MVGQREASALPLSMLWLKESKQLTFVAELAVRRRRERELRAVGPRMREAAVRVYQSDALKLVIVGVVAAVARRRRCGLGRPHCHVRRAKGAPRSELVAQQPHGWRLCTLLRTPRRTAHGFGAAVGYPLLRPHVRKYKYRGNPKRCGNN